MEWFPTTTNGVKRPAENELTSEQPLAKRLELLSIRTPTTHRKPPKPPQPPQAQRMDVDNVVYIDSLSDDEDEDEDEGKVIFIPDVEKRLTKIPENVLRAPEIELQTVKQGAGTSKDLVLYSVPKSLSVPDESDGVRKAIIESRARLRLKREAEEAERLQLKKVNASAAMADAMAVNGMGMNAMDGAGMMNGVNNMAASMNGMGIINGVNSVPVGYGDVYDPDEMDIE